MRTSRFENVSPATRKVMQANKGKDTKPEMVVRRLVYRMGYRYRLHRKDLPGKPDLVFGPRRKAIFVHGCFWHAHADCECASSRTPKTRVEFWRAKFARNKARDAANVAKLSEMGWRVMTVWECATRRGDDLAERVSLFLSE